MRSKIVLFAAALLLTGTSLASAQPGAAYQDRGNREQSIGVSDTRVGAHRQARHYRVKRSHVRHRASRSGSSTVGRGLPPGGRYQDMRQNESEGKTPDGRL